MATLQIDFYLKKYVNLIAFLPLPNYSIFCHSFTLQSNEMHHSFGEKFQDVFKALYKSKDLASTMPSMFSKVKLRQWKVRSWSQKQTFLTLFQQHCCLTSFSRYFPLLNKQCLFSKTVMPLPVCIHLKHFNGFRPLFVTNLKDLDWKYAGSTYDHNDSKVSMTD